MHITHFGHACVALESPTTRLLIDPGTLARGFEDLDDLDAVLITHQHADHFDPTRVAGLLSRSPKLRVYADEESARLVRDLGADPHVVADDTSFTIGDIRIDPLVARHATVHELIPTVPNIGFVIDDGVLYHPGDSFLAPDRPIDVLLLPTSGPWLKLGEAIDFVRTVSPRVAVPIHEAALANTATHHGYLCKFVPQGTTFVELDRGVLSTDV